MSEDVQTTTTLGQQLAAYGAATWLWVVFLSMLGGVASFAIKVRKGIARWINVPELLGECTISAFVGFVTFLITDGHVPPGVQAAMIAVSGHMGTRAVFLFEQFYASRIVPGGTPPAPDKDMPGGQG